MSAKCNYRVARFSQKIREYFTRLLGQHPALNIWVAVFFIALVFLRSCGFYNMHVVTLHSLFLKGEYGLNECKNGMEKGII